MNDLEIAYRTWQQVKQGTGRENCDYEMVAYWRDRAGELEAAETPPDDTTESLAGRVGSMDERVAALEAEAGDARLSRRRMQRDITQTEANLAKHWHHGNDSPSSKAKGMTKP